MVWTDADANASTFQTGMFDPAPALLGLDPMILDVCRTLAGDEARAPLPTDPFWRHAASARALRCPPRIGCKDGGLVSLLESNLLEACTAANRNILRYSALWQTRASWDMCVNMEWIACAARGMLPHQHGGLQFAVPPSRIDPGDHAAFRDFQADILRWSAHYEIDTVSWPFYAVELCFLVLLCDNRDELWELGRDDVFECRIGHDGRDRFVEALELVLFHAAAPGR